MSSRRLFATLICYSLLLFSCVSLPEPVRAPTATPGASLARTPTATTVVRATTAARPEPTRYPVSGDLHLAVREAISTLNPYLAATPTESFVCSLLYDSLLNYSTDDGMTPNLAERWTIGAEGATLTFWLNPRARWHDGRPVTMDDVLFSFDLIRHTDFPGMAPTASLITRVEALSPQEVRVLLATSRTDALRLIGQVPIVPRSIWEAIGDPLQYTNLESPIGSGPFAWDHADGDITVLRNMRQHHEDAPTMGALILHKLSDETHALELVQNGELDAIGWAVAANTAMEVESNAAQYPEVTVVRTPGTSMQTLLFNVRKPPYDASEFRRALALATDTSAIIAEALQGLADPGSPCLFAPGSPWRNPDLPPVAHAPEKAAQALQQAGFVDRDGDGLRENPDSSKLAVPILTDDLASHTKIAGMIAAGWRAIGIDASVQSIPQDQLLPSLIQAAFDVSWHETTLQEPEDAYFNLHSSKGTLREGRVFGLNYGGYTNPDVDELALACLEEARPTALLDLVTRLQKLLAAEHPQIPLYTPQTLTIARQSSFTDWDAEPEAGLLTRHSMVRIRLAANSSTG